MERSSKLLIVIGIGIILLAIGLWILLSPILLPPAQPPTLPTTVEPTTTIPPSKPTTTPGTTTAPSPVAADLKRLEDQAATFVARVGSGSNVDGFLGYVDVQVGATVAYRSVLNAERAALQAAHPATGPAYGITTRVVASHAQNTALDATVTIIVQAQVVEDAGNPANPTTVSYKDATVTMEKQSNNTYLVSGITWKAAGI